MTVRFKNDDGEEIVISKDGFGSKTVIGGQSKQEDNYKAAATDALKKAATLFGIAAQLYRDNNEEEFFNLMNDPWNDDEVYMKYQPEREFVRKILEQNNDNPNIINEELLTWSVKKFKDIQELKPKAFQMFIEYLKIKYDENGVYIHGNVNK